MIQLRSMNVEDIDYVLNIEKSLFHPPWKKEDFIYEIENNVFSSYTLLVEDDRILGYIGLWIIYEQLQIATLAIDPLYQGKGLSHLLMKHCMKEAKENGCTTLSLEVRVSNEVAIHLYENYGFKKVALRKDYYEDHEDAYLMVYERKEND